MKIVMVSGHFCIRVTKIALPLIESGLDVHVIAKKVINWSQYYKSFINYSDIGQFIEGIKLHSDADIFHVHNEPSWFVCAIKEIFPHKPVILDVHDTFLTRTTDEDYRKSMSEGLPHVRVTTEERNSFQLADALVFVSDSVAKVTVDEFALRQPYIILPSYVPYSLYQYHTKEWMGGLVYEGRVTLPSEYAGMNLNTGADYCNYEQVAKQALECGIDFHLYAGREDKPFKKFYDPMVFVHQGYDYKTLLKQISRHDWGLVGNLIDSPQWQQTLPNKLYDYIASGVPPVCINAKESSEAVEGLGLGITVDSLNELAERWAEHRECRNNIWKRRRDLAMDYNNSELKGLYRSLL